MIDLFDYFFFNDSPTTEIYTLSLHDALPIFGVFHNRRNASSRLLLLISKHLNRRSLLLRSEERFSRNAETDLVCRLLLEKKKELEEAHLERVLVMLALRDLAPDVVPLPRDSSA